MAIITGNELGSHSLGSTCLLVWASFEDRSLASVEFLCGKRDVAGFVVHFSEEDYDISQNLNFIRETSGFSVLKEVTFDREKQMHMLLAFADILAVMVDYDNVYVDISCFPRDALLILLLALMKIDSRASKVNIIYNLAVDYGFDETDPEKKWLSRGVVRTSPVLGFRGRVVPGRNLCVIGLLGLDDQRFLQVLDNLQPEKLAIGVGTSTDRDRNWLTAKNNRIANTLQSNFRSDGTFEFDCDSLADSFIACEQQYIQREGLNVCIVPMNNKISTLAVGLLALKYRNIQVCHGSALLYNMKGYSRRGEKFILMAMDSIKSLIN